MLSSERMSAATLSLAVPGLAFADLHRREGLIKLDQEFIAALEGSDAPLRGLLLRARAAPAELTQKDESELLLALAPPLERLRARLVGMGHAVAALRARHP